MRNDEKCNQRRPGSIFREREMMMWQKIKHIQWKSTLNTGTQCNLTTIQYHETNIMN